MGLSQIMSKKQEASKIIAEVRIKMTCRDEVQDCVHVEAEKTCPCCGFYYPNGLDAGNMCGPCAIEIDLQEEEELWDIN